jgi:hypothetical protein
MTEADSRRSDTGKVFGGHHAVPILPATGTVGQWFTVIGPPLRTCDVRRPTPAGPAPASSSRGVKAAGRVRPIGLLPDSSLRSVARETLKPIDVVQVS